MTSELNQRASDRTRDRWRAVMTRNRLADGDFVYAVRSTRVYCRPSCPSRRPHRSRVEFFPTPLAAREAGYRACKRCRPDENPPADPWTEKILDACAYLAISTGQPTLTTLARRFGGSPYHLQRSFKRIVGITPRQFAAACRLRNVRRRLQEGRDVTTALHEAGYSSTSRFYERAASRLGMTPTLYRNGGKGVIIRYTILPSPVGRLLVAATGRGVCAVSMGDRDAELTAALEAEYPQSTIVPDSRSIRKWTTVVLKHLAGQAPALDLPVDIRATAFQWQVWDALSAIPSGHTRSYADVAASIGRPRAVRAVARACAANPVALVIPCHRVVPRKGGAGGYRWGAERKEVLLQAERSRSGTIDR